MDGGEKIRTLMRTLSRGIGFTGKPCVVQYSKEMNFGKLLKEKKRKDTGCSGTKGKLE